MSSWKVTAIKSFPPGAIVRARFTTAVGKRLMMTLKDAQGKPVPFGAIVSQNTTTSIVGDEGSVFLTGMAEKGR